jgi:hypothetical protein
MSYWVYENTNYEIVRIHRGDCTFCKEGKGIHGGGKRVSGQWLGPFSELNEAIELARHQHQPDTRPCKFCMKQIKVKDVFENE